MEVQRLAPGDSDYPSILVERLAEAAPPALYSLGDPGILRRRLFGLICSIKCPGSIVIKTFDAIRELRDAGVTMIGGFHSPMERECLDLLLRGAQPAVLCPARRLSGLRIGQKARKALAEGRLLLLSSFGDEVRRVNSIQAMRRNDLVAALAVAVLVPYAAPEGRTWATVGRAIGRGRLVLTFDDRENTALLARGARPYRSDDLDTILTLNG
ncbi:MAG: DNA-processing protein DprA [Thermodesulfobacteriota bacterium]